MSAACPTEKQYVILRSLGNGSAVVSVKLCADCAREWEGVCRRCGSRSYRFEERSVGGES